MWDSLNHATIYQERGAKSGMASADIKNGGTRIMDGQKQGGRSTGTHEA